jgi:hypothetical protein
MQRVFAKITGSFGLLTILTCTLAQAAPGVWIGLESKKDPVTDRMTSNAFLADKSDTADLVVRCRNEGLDMLLAARSVEASA